MSREKSHQLNLLAEQQMAIEAEEAKAAGALWYYSRTMCQCVLPSSSWPSTEYVQNSGKFHMVVQALPPLHVPWGIYPRGILSWVVTEVKLNRKKGDAARTLHLGSSLSEFIYKVSGTKTVSGGKTGNIKAFKKQLSSLFSSRIAFWIGEGNSPDVSTDTAGMMQIGVGWNLMWHLKVVDQPGLVQSTVQLSEEFFEDCLKHGVPIDIRVVRGLWGNCMAFDAYCWLTYKAEVLRYDGRSVFDLSWPALKMQFGPRFLHLKHFRTNFLASLRLVKLLYSDFEFREQEGKGIVFRFRAPSIKSVAFHGLPAAAVAPARLKLRPKSSTTPNA